MNEKMRKAISYQNETEKFMVTRQVDIDVANKVDRIAFQKAAQLIELPKVIKDHQFVFITLICQATNEGKNEIWEKDGGAYITISLNHDFVFNHPLQKVTHKFLQTYQGFIGSVSEVPSISVLEDRKK